MTAKSFTEAFAEERADVRWAELARIAAAATPPSTGSTSWVVDKCGGGFEVYTGPISDDSEDVACGIFREADATFIAAARTAVPDLLAEVLSLRSLLESARNWAVHLECQNEMLLSLGDA